MRLFIAIELPENIVSILKDIQSKLPSAKLSKTSEFHLTLKFLGETDNADEIKEKLSKIQFDRFQLTIEDIGVFPSESYIRVVWVGLTENKELLQLQKQIEQQLPEFKSDYQFKAHLTLARIKYIDDKAEFLDKIKKIRFPKDSFEVKQFYLIKSTLTSQGPVYDTVAEFKCA